MLGKLEVTKSDMFEAIHPHPDLSHPGRGIILACSVTPAGPAAIAARQASGDKSGGELIDGVGVDADFGAVAPLDIRRCSAIILRSQSTLSSHRRLCEICIFFLLRKT
jgi:hypothetical protein